MQSSLCAVTIVASVSNDMRGCALSSWQRIGLHLICFIHRSSGDHRNDLYPDFDSLGNHLIRAAFWQAGNQRRPQPHGFWLFRKGKALPPLRGSQVDRQLEVARFPCRNCQCQGRSTERELCMLSMHAYIYIYIYIYIYNFIYRQIDR